MAEGSIACLAVLDLIEQKIAEHPRGLQITLGASEVGHPCPRWLAYKLSGATAGPRPPAWRPQVGTAVHTMLGNWLREYEAVHPGTWLTDIPVIMGMITDGHPLKGTLDAFHIPTRTVVDFKIPGPAAMKKYRGSHPESPQYRTQIHCYGYGLTLAGIPVDKVALLRLPSAGELTDAIIREEEFDPRIALEALSRARLIAEIVAAGGLATAAALPGVDHYCSRCEWFKPNSINLITGCPGVGSYIPDPTFGGLLSK